MAVRHSGDDDWLVRGRLRGRSLDLWCRLKSCTSGGEKEVGGVFTDGARDAADGVLAGARDVESGDAYA
jgi:hypothetical protein